MVQPSPAHEYVTVNGVKLHYVRMGSGEPLFLIHGWPGFWYEWHENIVPLAQHFDVIAPDMRGYAYSDKPDLPPAGGYSDAAYAEDLRSKRDLTISDLVSVILGRDLRPESLETTVNAAMQQAAFEALDGQKGAIVALDPSTGAVLTAVSSPQADEVGRMRTELRRLVFDEQMRSERRRSTGTAIESPAAGGLKPWREVVNPHPDVASGRYQQAEFAADLWQVHLGEGADDYRDPAEFFRRSFLTESL